MLVVRLALALTALLLTFPVAEAQKVVVSKRVTCPPEMSANDTSLVSYHLRDATGKCGTGGSSNSLFAVDDGRLGIWWFFAPNTSISITVKPVEEMNPKDLAETMTSCVTQIIFKDEIILDEWLVPNNVSCNNRGGDFVPRYRRYINDRVCFMGTFNCIMTTLLKPLGQTRVQAVFDRLKNHEATQH